MKLKDILKLLEVISLKKGIATPYIIGGTVRDKYLNKLDKLNDIDITTGDRSVNFLVKDFVQLLQNDYHIKAQEMNDGHSSVMIGNLKIDFSSNFINPGINKLLLAKGIKKPTDMQKELFSRDFTCNTLLMTLDLKKIIDPTNLGIKDCEQKLIRTCLSPEITLKNNKNRVIRAIYLAAKLGFELAPELKAWIKNNPNSILISSEKALKEKLAEAAKYDLNKTIKYLDELNLWNYVPMIKEIYPSYQAKVKND